MSISYLGNFKILADLFSVSDLTRKLELLISNLSVIFLSWFFCHSSSVSTSSWLNLLLLLRNNLSHWAILDLHVVYVIMASIDVCSETSLNVDVIEDLVRIVFFKFFVGLFVSLEENHLLELLAFLCLKLLPLLEYFFLWLGIADQNKLFVCCFFFDVHVFEPSLGLLPILEPIGLETASVQNFDRY